ncbi:MAG: primosomal replication protein N [Neisseriaceae bacterium]|nr:primosomal replication protein N [Neisseriaceae bacterium]MBR2252489.1 primosomal replication protein N [Neisseriaceae bacterium]
MSNNICLEAVIISQEPLRYTPSGTPVLSLLLEHSSAQIEAGQSRKTAFTISAKQINPANSVLNVGDKVKVVGFLNSKSHRNPELILHIQHIERIE